MRVVFALVAGMIAAPAAAQTAVTMDFTQNQPTASGAQIRASPGFTEFQLGIWKQPAAPETGAIVADTIDDTAPPSSLLAPSAVVSADTLDPCAVEPVPRYIAGLSVELVMRRLAWWPVVSASECRYGIPAGLLDAVILQESRYRVSAISPKGAVGLAQLMPGTANELGVANAFDPHGNIDGGARYLRKQLDRFNAVHLGVAAYNAGPGAVRAAGRIPRNGETPDYVRRVLGYWSNAIEDPVVEIRRTAQRLGFIDPKED